MLCDYYNFYNVQQAQQQKKTMSGVQKSEVKPVRRRSAPLSVKQDNLGPRFDHGSGGGEWEAEDKDISYQSTLLHVRVVGET